MSELRSMVMVTRRTQPENMQLSDCVREAEQDDHSPVEEFEGSLKALAKMAASMSGFADPNVIGEMLIVAAVASVEAYFRGVLSSLAGCCPYAAHQIREDTITFGAAISYPPRYLALAGLERTLFSSSGVISAQITRFTGFELKNSAELKAAVTAFESACTCRHSIAHWRGNLDSATMRGLGLTNLTSRRYMLETSFALVQRVLAACDHLVHVANQLLFDLTLNKWIAKGHLGLEYGDEMHDLEKCVSILAVFGSSLDGGSVTSPEALLLIAKAE